jgi:serine/threonine protein kinase
MKQMPVPRLSEADGLQKEGMNASRLSLHPRVVKIFDTFKKKVKKEEGGSEYLVHIVMEMCPGGSLNDDIANRHK